MQDHAFVAAYEGIRECHLAGDVLLLYSSRNDELRLLIVVDHDETKGPRGSALAKRIRSLK